MKIGIMSMQRIKNYGSVMQALALKMIIGQMGHEVEFVDFHVKPTLGNRTLKAKLANKKNNLMRFIVSHRMLLNAFNAVGKLKKYDQNTAFTSCNGRLPITAAYRYNSKVDVLVIGSDEVFNCTQRNPDVGYSLELFGKNNRAKKLISYAASFGSTTMTEIGKYNITDEIKYYLNKFNKISVRDNNSFGVVKALCGIEPEIHLDPVLVGNLEEMQWQPVDLEKFIIVYGYGNRFTEKEGEYIKAFAKKRGCRIVALAGNQAFADDYIRCAPDQVLSYFKKADCIITDTFHGSIFSAICHKQFVTICRRKGEIKAGHASNEEKLTDMLERLGLMGRLAASPEEIEKIIDKPIDYDAVERIRARERERTVEYLKQNLVL